jgi:hypothetical protein
VFAPLRACALNAHSFIPRHLWAYIGAPGILMISGPVLVVMTAALAICLGNAVGVAVT